MERREQSLGFQRGLLFIYFLLAGKLILCELYVHTCTFMYAEDGL